MTFSKPPILIVGGSVAGVSAADTLRQEGFAGEIIVVGDEPHTAYSRPSLSKGLLRGDEDAEMIRLPPLDPSVEVRTGARAIGLDINRRVVKIEQNGHRQNQRFDGLVIATGAQARSLGMGGDRNEFVLRGLDHSLALSSALKDASSAIIVGGGFLAFELASSIRGMGLAVTVVHARPPLSRHLGGELADLMVSAAREAGVEFIAAGTGALGLAADGRGIQLADGSVLTADVVVSAIGDSPNVEWLAGSGLVNHGALEVGAGGVVAPGIVAAGDVTATRSTSGRFERTPFWHSAIAQGRGAARALLRLAPLVPKTPYSWTEGFGIELKITGRIPLGIAPTVLEGSLKQHDAVLQWRVPDGRPVAAATVNHRMPLIKLSRLAEPQLTEVNT
jgi:3-phenylpropionate/trans-cinnamate dioxygenase ferredoxin reductase component